MALYRSYNIQCDGCQKIHNATASSPRYARAAARRQGWARRKVVVGQHEAYNWTQTPQGHWVASNDKRMVDDYAGKDFCKECLDKMEATDAHE